MLFTSYDKFLCCRLKGEERDAVLCAMDVANGRLYEGNGIGLMSSTDASSSKKTLQKNGGRDFIWNEDGSVSPSRGGFMSKGKDWVLGVKLVRDGIGFSIGGGGTY